MRNLSVPCGLILALAVSAQAQTPNKCSELTKFRIPGVTMAIAKAETIPASDSAPSHCQADGVIEQWRQAYEVRSITRTAIAVRDQVVHRRLRRTDRLRARRHDRSQPCNRYIRRIRRVPGQHRSFACVHGVRSRIDRRCRCGCGF